ncbi:MAG: hypothetical protein JNM27_00520 [Leptospirales bacterium]|nr:hypothetical protein [Leptospirales bacterium]
MRIAADYIGFDNLNDLNLFLIDQGLQGGFFLAEPIKDKAGNILIKEKILVKDSSLKRLESMDGNYETDFRVLLTPDLLKQLRTYMTRYITGLLKKSDFAFIAHLFQNTRLNYHLYIQNAFNTDILLLTFYKQLTDNREFFDHIAHVAMLSMGIIVQKGFGIPRLHRYAFLCGLLADTPLATSDEWRTPLPEKRRLEIANAACKFAARLGIPREVGDALQDYPLQVSKPEKDDTPIAIVEASATPENEEVEKAPEAAGETDGTTVRILTQVLRLAIYIQELSNHIEDPKTFTEKVVSMVAYNGARGYFHPDLVELIIERFKEFEQVARRMMVVAKVESNCIHPPSAWAYPKPRAAQVLCRNRVDGCPNLVSGWDINIVSPLEAFGWIGATLDAGSYPKCTLEGGLEKD